MSDMTFGVIGFVSSAWCSSRVFLIKSSALSAGVIVAVDKTLAATVLPITRFNSRLRLDVVCEFFCSDNEFGVVAVLRISMAQ
jgi:hypothetical protein